VTSLNCPWVFAFLILGEVTMQYIIQLDPVVEQLIEDLRMKHIDAELIIKEELDQTLPEYIECFLRGICGEVKNEVN
jgi:hypothetical protein